MIQGFKLNVYDINKSAVTNLVDAGACGVPNVAEVAKNSEVVITMLPANDHVWNCYTGENGLLR